MKIEKKRLMALFLCFLLTMTAFIPAGTVVNAKGPEDITGDEGMIGERRTESDDPLIPGEIQSIQSDRATFSISLKDGIISDIEEEPKEEEEPSIIESILDFIFPAKVANAASDTLKVSYDGYVSYCGRQTGYKYVSSSGDYHNRLVYCLDVGKNTTEGTIVSGKNVNAKITFCLVNGARKKGGLCVNDKYSSGSAQKDYFITGAAIHVLNGEVKLSYFNDGSGVYKNIKQMVEDAKKISKDDYNFTTGTTRKISYELSPSKSNWTEISTGLYRSEEKFVRVKTGTITEIKYQFKGVPSGLSTGEISKSSSEINDPSDLSGYDVCISQTNSDSASSNFYVYANQEAMDRIVADQAVVKVTGTAYGDEYGGKSWTPSVSKQQKVTFLMMMEKVKSASDSVKLVPGEVRLGQIFIQKTDQYSNKPIDGASYSIYEDEDCEELLCDLEQKDGDMGFGLYGSDINELTQDTYYLKETMNPDGYEMDERVIPIDIRYFTIKDSAGNVITQGETFTHRETPEKTSVMIRKTDTDIGTVVTNAKFALFDDEACTVRTRESEGGAELPYLFYDADLDAYVSERFTKHQEYYYIKEVEVPRGYQDTGEVYRVSPETGDMATLDTVNKAIRCELSLKKEDKETRIPQGDAKLVGAQYGIYADETIMYPDGTRKMRGSEIQLTKGTDFVVYDIDADKDALLATAKTDANGELGFKNMLFGKYYVKEIEPSEGYLLDEEKHAVDYTALGSSQATLSIDVTSKEMVMKQAAEIIKVSTNGKTGETPKVEGAEFTIKLASEIAAKGWDSAKVYDKITTDRKGFARTIELPYGRYTVRETRTPKDLDTVPDFEIVVDHDDRTPQEWRVFNDAPFETYIKLIKKDEESGKEILLKDTTFKIRKVGQTDFIRQKLGNTYIEEFKTDETGTVMTPLKLMYGDYEVVEVTAPNGYVMKNVATPFTITSSGAVKVERDKDGDAVIGVEIQDTPVKAKLSIKKIGEKLSGVQYDTIIDRILDLITGDQRSVTFKYEDMPLAGAKFDLVAAEDIYTPDHQIDNGVRTLATYNGKDLKSGEIVTSVITDDKGEAQIDKLPLGKYILRETEAPLGYVRAEDKEIVFEYKDDKTSVIEQAVELKDERQKTEVQVIKTEKARYSDEITAASGGAVSVSGAAVMASPLPTSTPTSGAAVAVTGSAITILNGDTAGIPVAGATYGIYCTKDIKNHKGEVLVEANTLIAAEKTDENGHITFTADLPLGLYYVKEISTAPGYVKDEKEYEVDFQNPEKNVKVIKKDVEVSDTPIITQISKTDITESIELPDAKLQVIDKNDEVFAEWTSDGTPFSLIAIPPGDYVLKEIAAPVGYNIATEATFTVDESLEIKKVTMIDERAKGVIEIEKTDIDSKKAIEGVQFVILDEEGNEVETITTDSDGIARSGELDIGEYAENGVLVRPYKYSVKEKKAADGYKLKDNELFVEFEADGTTTEPIVKNLHITNERIHKLPQTGGSPMPLVLVGTGVGIGAAVYFFRRKKRIGGKRS